MVFYEIAIINVASLCYISERWESVTQKVERTSLDHSVGIRQETSAGGRAPPLPGWIKVFNVRLETLNCWGKHFKILAQARTFFVLFCFLKILFNVYELTVAVFRYTRLLQMVASHHVLAGN